MMGFEVAVECWEDGHAGDDDADELFCEVEEGDDHDGEGLIGITGFLDLVAESRDAGEHGEAADDEDGAQFPFLLRRHVQSPDADDGDDEDHDVAGDVDDGGADQHGVFVDALAACGHDGVFADAGR